ncbi:hypothetical protein [Rhizocola hellebori]|nr:hypothetical protein [Rhizocola hellebori]
MSAPRDWQRIGGGWRANHSAPALLHRVDPRRGLSDADFDAIAQWLSN